MKYNYLDRLGSLYSDFKKLIKMDRNQKKEKELLFRKTRRKMTLYNRERIDNLHEQFKKGRVVHNGEEVTVLSGQKKAQKPNLDVFAKAKLDKKDLRVLRELTRNNMYDIKGDIRTFYNPLLKKKFNKDTKNKKLKEMQERLLVLKEKKKEKIKDHIYKVNKLIILKEDIEEFRDKIRKLKSFQGEILSRFEEDPGEFSRASTVRESLSELSLLSDIEKSKKINVCTSGDRMRRMMISKKTFSLDTPSYVDD